SLRAQKWERQQVPLLESSLPRGPVPPSSSSSCTYIPGQGGGPCPSMEASSKASTAAKGGGVN
ncbi:Unknown protein, partial [Striga hermonthica]